MTDHFTELAATWDDNPIPVAIARDLLSFIERHVALDEVDLALDYGCGTGLVSLPLAQRVGRVHGMDDNEGMRGVCAQKMAALSIDNVTLAAHQFPRDPLPADTYALATSSMVLHHIEDVAAFVTACFAMLRPGGACCFADLDREDGSFHPPGIEGIFHHGFDREELGQWFIDAGFDPPQFETIHVVEREGVSYPIFGVFVRRR